MENRFLGSISASSIKSLFPKSVPRKQKMLMKSRVKLNPNMENVPPMDPNIQIDDPPLLPSSSFPKMSPSKPIITRQEPTRSDTECVAPIPPDPPVQVVVRIRPLEGLQNGECIVKKFSHDSVSCGNEEFKFDSVFDANATQEEVFQKVGVPLVNDALAGYNTSILAYGQSGSGKTYTLWGPTSALVGTPSATDRLGIVPRIFGLLFAKIQQDKEKSTEGRQINYQCRCSFLEIYNGQIGDLLDPTQRNLEIKDDVQKGFYIENLTEEYITSYEDVTQILVRGLSRKKVGATSTNSKSSTSHVIFTCIIDSWCKESSKCLVSSKTSRMSLVDLAGFDTNMFDGAGAQCPKEGNFVMKSRSQLENLINALVKTSRLEIYEGIPCGSSCLPQVLKKSLGGNAKLYIMCAIIPDQRFSSETASTLRFGKQVKLAPNELIINEKTENDANDLPNQIRQLKEELLRENLSDSVSVRSNNRDYNGQSFRESLKQLRLCLNQSLILPSIVDNSTVAACADETDLKELRVHTDRLQSSSEEDIKETEGCLKELRVHTDRLQSSSEEDIKETEGCETDLTSDHYVSCSEESENEEIKSEGTLSQILDDHEDKGSTVPAVRNSIVISGRSQSEVLEGPMFSESPKLKTTNRKSMISMSSNSIHQHNDAQEITKRCKFGQSVQHADQFRSSLRSSRKFPGSTESLAASLRSGLEIINYHQRKSTLDMSSVSFSFGNLAQKPSPVVDKANASAKTLPEERQSSDMSSVYFLCRNCKHREIIAPTEVQDSLKTWNFEGKNSNENSNSMPNDVDKASGQPTEKDKELENVCKEQVAKIDKLNQQLLRLNGNENHGLVVIEEECEVKHMQSQPDQVRDTQSVDETGKEDLLKEIACLRSQLQLRNDGTTANRSIERIGSSLLAQSIQLRKSGAFNLGNSKEDIDRERQRWTEMESEWICLTDELRIELESQRQRAEKVEMKLRLEKKCTEELDDALKRSILGHATIVEQYAELQETHNDLVGKHHILMEAVAEVKRAAEKAEAKGRHGSRFAKSVAAELSAARVEREREMALLRKENTNLKTQLRDTTEAVHAAGELLVRLREAEETALVAEGNLTTMQEENDKLKNQLEKLKRKHKMEMNTMKQYLAESRLPQSALRPLYEEDLDTAHNNSAVLVEDDDQAWRAEFGEIYQEQHY